MFGFKASFGSLKLKNLEDDFFPLIAFNNNGEAILINSYVDNGKVSVTLPLTNETKLLNTDFNSNFSGYVIIAKALNKREKKKNVLDIGFLVHFAKANGLRPSYGCRNGLQLFITYNSTIYYDCLRSSYTERSL